MSNNRQRDYLARHCTIRDELINALNDSGRGCVDVSQMACRLGMDTRTVRAHLEIMEVDAVGVFLDTTRKQFCTKEGVALLANSLKLTGGSTE